MGGDPHPTGKVVDSTPRDVEQPTPTLLTEGSHEAASEGSDSGSSVSRALSTGSRGRKDIMMSGALSVYGVERWEKL
jgi:hypothetical protein